MFDGSLFVEMIRARCLLELAESTRRGTEKPKRWGYILGRVGDALIASGQRLKSYSTFPPSAYGSVEGREQQQ